jgi:hypothetical protein
MLALIVATNLYFFANYVGDLDHYLLITWLAATLWLAVALEAGLTWLERRVLAARLRPELAGLALALPIAIGAGNWAVSDQSENRAGEAFADSVFAALPTNAVLVTYWDALTTLGYEHCVDARRPDVAMRALDVTARVVCDPVEGTLEDVAASRPLFALFVTDGELNSLRPSFTLVPGPTLAVPYGKRGLDHRAVLYRLELRTSSRRAGERTVTSDAVRVGGPDHRHPAGGASRSSAAARRTAATIGW